jgi:hypothetical protein
MNKKLTNITHQKLAKPKNCPTKENNGAKIEQKNNKKFGKRLRLS